nr:MAG TPA: hypothetical protein [Crassvirales sp.]
MVALLGVPLFIYNFILCKLTITTKLTNQII